MACVLPPELDEQDLWKYLAGEADQQVTMHLRECPYCREKAGSLARLQGHLIHELYRCTCPSPIELGEYHLGLLPHDRAAAIARHLAECPHCSREVAGLENYLTELAPSLEPDPLEQTKERVKIWVAQLVGGGPGVEPAAQLTLAPAYAGLRGKEKEPLIFQTGDIQIAIEVQDDAERPGRRAILGLVIGEIPEEMEAHLWKAGQHIAEVPVDELGGFDISDVAPDNYELILSSPEVEIHIRDLRLETS
ncbi:MAG: hypothetical protein JXA21_15210 [Anaerolineae bacterium]|nr:hypothetical protein [Anaerolineae bacterium]